MKPPWLIVLVLTLGFWWWHPTFFIADDSYFYPVIARNLALRSGQTFSGIMPTNGVHPLWLYLLTAYTYGVSLLAPEFLRNPAYAVPLSIASLSLGAWFFSKAAEELHLGPVFVLLPLAYLAVEPVLYSEAHLFYATLGLLTWIVIKRRPNPIALGFVAGLVMLSRLDSVFFLGSLFAWLLVLRWRLRSVFLSGATLVVVVIPYLICNFFEFAGLVPVSGWIKSSFPHVFLKGFVYASPSGAAFLGYNLPFGLVPIGAAGIILPRMVRLNSKEGVGFVYMLGCILSFLYIACFARYGSYWGWYYVEPIILIGFALSVVLGSRWARSASYAAVTIAIGALLILPRPQRVGGGGLETLRFVEKNKIHRKTIFVSDWPGYIAFFASDNHILAADMLTSNRRFVEQMDSSHDALRFLEQSCSKAGKPIDLFIFNGSEWIHPSRDLLRVTYCDPRKYPVCAPIGSMAMGQPVFVSSDRWFIVVWKWPAHLTDASRASVHAWR